MHIFLRFLWRAVDRIPWVVICSVVFIHFVSTWFAMYYFEPKGTEFVAADVYWWFYSVTATTVGYGDFSPATLGGRITAFIVMIGGITAMSGVFAKLASTFLNFWNKRKTGMAQLKQTDHVIVIGDGSNRTSKVVSNLLADTTSAEVVLISHLEKNTTDTTLFVHGEITDPIVQKRACVSTASLIIILAENDAEATGRVVTILKKIRDNAIITVFLSEEASANAVFDLDDRIRTVSSIDMAALVQEAQDPGAAKFAKTILSNDAPGTYFRLDIPENLSISLLDLSQKLLLQGVTLIGTYGKQGIEILMDPKQQIGGNTTLAVIAPDRKTLDTLSWS